MNLARVPRRQAVSRKDREFAVKGFGSPRGTQIRTRFWRVANALHSPDR